MRASLLFLALFLSLALAACGDDSGAGTPMDLGADAEIDFGAPPIASGASPSAETTAGRGVVRGAWWLHPVAADQSRLVSVEEDSRGRRGYNVYDATGESIRVDREGNLTLFAGNGVEGPVDVDVVYEFPFTRRPSTLVIGADAADGTLDLLEMDEVTGDLQFPEGSIGDVPGLTVDTEATLTGVCAYRNAEGAIYAFALAGTEILMYELFQNAGEDPSGTLVRSFTASAPAVGCVVDETLLRLHVALGLAGIETFDAAPDGSATGEVRNPRDAFFGGAADVSFYRSPSQGGHLLVASAADGAVAILDGITLEFTDERFAVTSSGGIDAVMRTTGIDVINARIAGDLEGAVAVVDGVGGGTNFKLVSWAVLRGTFPLDLDDRFDPRL
ncbi:MAG: phytase [Myxococcota bacterium]